MNSMSRAFRVAELTDVEVAASPRRAGVNPASKSRSPTARGAGPRRCAGRGSRRRSGRAQARGRTPALLELQEQGVVGVAAEQQHDPRRGADAAEPDDLARRVDVAVSSRRRRRSPGASPVGAMISAATRRAARAPPGDQVLDRRDERVVGDDARLTVDHRRQLAGGGMLSLLCAFAMLRSKGRRAWRRRSSASDARSSPGQPREPESTLRSRRSRASPRGRAPRPGRWPRAASRRNRGRGRDREARREAIDVPLERAWQRRRSR